MKKGNPIPNPSLQQSLKDIEKLDKHTKEISKKVDERETNKERKEKKNYKFELSPTQIKNLQNKGITTQDGKPLFPKEEEWEQDYCYSIRDVKTKPNNI